MVEDDARATLEPVTDVNRVAAQWSALEKSCDATMFQSSAWLMPWLDTALDHFDVQLVRAEKSGRIVCLGLLVRRKVRRRLFSVETLFLNETGPSKIDFCIEHNGFLLHRGYEKQALMAILRCLRQALSWDELHLRRAVGHGAVQELSHTELAELGLRLIRADATVAPCVDLEEIRTRGDSFINGLTSNRRAQIRRAMRNLERLGTLHVDAARTLAEAMQYLEGLKAYHQPYWESRGEPGVFANREWETFHQKLMAARWDTGGVQLLRFTAGRTIVGYIYSLVLNGHVYMIQSGFNYELDPKSHPGECCHVMAIEWNLKMGNRAYDFLAGDMRYKRSLANRIIPVEGLVLQRKRWRFMVEDALRAIYHRMQVAGESASA